MIPNRISRVEELLKREISNILQTELHDPKIGFITITKVKAARDLRDANVWVSVFKDRLKDKQDTLDLLTSYRSRIQEYLSHRTRLRYMPHLNFMLDLSIEYSSHIDEVIERLKKEEGREEPNNE